MQTESAAPIGVDGVKVESGAAPATAGTTEPEGTGASVSMEGLTDEQKYELEMAEYRRKMVVYEQEKAKYDAEMAAYNKKVKETHKQVAEKVSASNKLACRPLTEVPFASLKDAIERLLPYHVYEAPDEDEAHHGLVPPIVERRKRKDGEGGTTTAAEAKKEKGEKRGDDDSEVKREGDDSAEDTTEEVEVCPARSRTQAWSELCAQYARDFKRELDDKRRRVDAFDAGIRLAAAGDGSGSDTRGPSALRPEEAYVAEMLAFEETKRRHEELRAEVRRAEAEVRRFRDEQLARLANRERDGGVHGDAGKSGEPDPSRPDVPTPSTNVLPGVPIARAD
jgi:hypothetical protein